MQIHPRMNDSQSFWTRNQLHNRQGRNWGRGRWGRAPPPAFFTLAKDMPKKRGAALFNFNNSIVRMTLHGFKTKFAATHLSYKVIDQIHYTHMDP